jgi:ribosomal protein S18 acetylase RimI-like enzyme
LTASAVSVEEAAEVTPELVDALARLVPQLSQSAPPVGEAEVGDMVASPAIRLLVARDDTGAIVGTLSLVLFRIPTGVRGWIEDVIVDEAARGRGVGEALTAEAIRLANAAGARTLDLTSRPSREAAHRLYTKMGFGVRETSVYRYDPTA